MKNRFFIPLILLAVILAGCKNTYDGTTANFKEKSQEITSNTGVSEAKSGVVDFYNYSDTATKKHRIDVFIASYAKLNIESVKEAITFYSLKDNTDNAAYYPMHDKTLDKEFVRAEELKNYFGYNDPVTNKILPVATIVYFEVNTFDVETDYIAAIVDATKLKDKQGNFVLNLDENYKAGQVSDSYIAYLEIDYKNDGTTFTTSLNYQVSETFAPRALGRMMPVPVLLVDPNSFGGFGVNSSDNVNDEGKLTGKIDFTIDCVPVNNTEDGSATEYDKTLATMLNSCISLGTKKPAEEKYNEAKLTWTYDETNSQYKATSDVLDYGTSWEFLLEMPESFPTYDWVEKVYGHPLFTDIQPKGAKDKIISGSSTIYLTQPDYIINNLGDAANSGDNWAPQHVDEADVENYQAAALTVTTSNTGANRCWKIRAAGDREFATCDDFVIFSEISIEDDKGNTIGTQYTKIETVVKPVKKSDGSIDYVVVEFKNKKQTSTLDTHYLGVGNGVSLKEGTNTAYPKQLKFGTYKNVTDGAASGYVFIWNN